MSVVMLPPRNSRPVDKGKSFMPEYLRQPSGLLAHYEALPSRERLVKQGESVYRYGEPAEEVFVVKTGAMILMRGFVNRHDDIGEECTGIRGPGEAFGALHDPNVYHEEAEALVDTTLSVYTPDMLRVKHLILELRRQNVLTNEALSIAQGGATLERVARVLVILNHKGICDSDEGIPLTYPTLARLLGVSRESISRAVIELRKANMISVSKQNKQTLNIERLATLAGYRL